MTETLLYCSGCKSTKPETDFNRHKTRKTGRGNWCRTCLARILHSPEYLARRREWRDKNKARSLIIECKSRAKAKGLEFDLTVADIVIPERCPILGVLLATGAGAGGRRNDTSVSIDRIDPTRGYVRGNVEVISWLANRLKSDCGDPAVFEAIAAHLRRRGLGGNGDQSWLPAEGAVRAVS